MMHGDSDFALSTKSLKEIEQNDTEKLYTLVTNIIIINLNLLKARYICCPTKYIENLITAFNSVFDIIKFR